MLESAGILVAFAVIMVMIKKKVSLALAMASASLIVLVASGKSLPFMLNLFGSAIIDQNTVDLALIVAIITALAALMNRYSFFDKMVAALGTMLRNDRLTLMIVPGLIGSMPMVGGAIVSAPIVDTLGERMNLSGRKRSAANLIFRHSWYFVFPFMPTFILTARLAEVSIAELLWIQWPMAVAMLGAGYYFVLVRGKPPTAATTEPSFEDEGYSTPMGAVRSFLLHSSPILLSLVLHLGFGVHLALALMLGMALVVTILKYIKQQAGFKVGSVPRQILRDIDYPIAGAMIGIMIFRASVNETTAISDLMTTMVEAGLPLFIITAGLASIIGFISASHTSTVAVVIPVVAPIAMAMGKSALVYVMLAYCFAFIFYLISPLHLCQILTNRYFKVSFGEVARLCLPVIIAVAATALGVGLLHGGM